MSDDKLSIGLLAVPEVAASSLYGMYDIFAAAGRDWAFLMEGKPGDPPLEPRVVSRSGTCPMTVTNGISIVPDINLDHIPQVACVPEISLPPHTPLSERFAPEIDWVRRCHAGGSLIATACSGALLLAEAGLLRGEIATTHWAYCDALARYPDVRVHQHQALVVGGVGNRLIMAGGGTSWEDLSLYLVARLVSVEEAMHLAKLFLIDWHDTGQLPYAVLSQTRQTEDATIGQCQAWIAHHYDSERTPVTAMMRRSGLSERTFHRRFKQVTGLTPMDYVHTLRLEEAKHLLERDTLPVEAIAEEVGYEDRAFFGRLFRRKVGLTPKQYRRRFGNLRVLLTEASSISSTDIPTGSASQP